MRNFNPTIEEQIFMENLHSVFCKLDTVQKCGCMFDSMANPSLERIELLNLTRQLIDLNSFETIKYLNEHFRDK